MNKPKMIIRNGFRRPKSYQVDGLTIQQSVANGVRWLDERFPGWADRINPRTLAMDSCSKCICGQLFKVEAEEIDENEDGYGYAYSTLFTEANAWIAHDIPLPTKKILAQMDHNVIAWAAVDERRTAVATYLGFAAKDGTGWGELTREWRKVIRERKAQRIAEED
jgi:hypothetical protein